MGLKAVANPKGSESFSSLTVTNLTQPRIPFISMGGLFVDSSTLTYSATTGLSTSNPITSTVTTGTAPLVVASTTNVANLNASSLGGATFAAPGVIGGGTPGAITGTTITATTQFNVGASDVVLNRNAAGRMLLSADGVGSTGTNVGWIIGNDASGSAALWVSSLTPSTSNMALYANSTLTEVNAATGGSVRLAINDVSIISVNASGMNGILGASTPAAASVTTLTTSATSGTGTAAIIDGSSVLRPLTSSLRFKKNVRAWTPSDADLDRFLSVDPIVWDYKDGDFKDVLGFGAEHLAGVNSELVNFDKDGRPYSNRDHAIMAYLHAAVRRLEARA